jgi:hypothetical protein
MRKPRPKLPAALRTPIRYPKLSLLEDISEGLTRADAQVFEERMAKLQLLARHHQIDVAHPHWPILLAWTLAIAHHKGFQIEGGDNKAPNREKIFDRPTIATLLLRVEVAKLEQPGLSDIEACEMIVAEDHPNMKGSRQKASRLKQAKNLTRYLAPARKGPLGSALEKVRKAVITAPK